MAEMVIVLPILLALVTAIVGFGITFNHYLALTDAARTGARAAAVSAGAPDPVASATQAVRNAASDLDGSQLGIAVCATSAPPCVAPTWRAGSSVAVITTYPYSISVFGLPLMTGTLKSSTTERVE
jgi:Flp pilus assembly protein TadG